jgi:hypothetical protein
MFKKIINQNPVVHNLLRNLYGKTIGFWWMKDWYAKKVGFYNGRLRLKLLSHRDADVLMGNLMSSENSFMVARYGSVEFRNLFSDKEMYSLCNNAGFFPRDSRLLKKFRSELYSASKEMDVLGVWNYQNHFVDKIKLLKKMPRLKALIPLSSIDAKDASWIKELEGKNILVIHPFEETIKSQMKKRKQLGILPKLKSLQIIKAVQTIAGNKDPRFETWFDALDYMKKEIDKKDFDVALIGCGAYGLPLASHVKSIGKKAIHVGGGLQLLFGIKGKRWERSGRYNKYWIYPLEKDTPSDTKKVEGSCYWK